MYSDQTLLLSVVVPVYSGEAYIEKLAAQLLEFKIMLETHYEHIRLGEAIFVSDDAIDSSPDILNQICEKYDWINVLHLARNYGQHPATIAGILHSSGDWVVTLDEDLQHPPSKILALLDRVKHKLTGVSHIPKFNSFRLIRGPIARASGSVCGPDTYLDIAMTWFTNRIEAVDLTLKDERYIDSGKSGYSLSSLLSHARRMAFSSRINALRFGAALGLLVSGLSILAICLCWFKKLMESHSSSLLIGQGIAYCRTLKVHPLILKQVRRVFLPKTQIHHISYY